MLHPLSICGIPLWHHRRHSRQLRRARSRSSTRHPEIPFWLCVGDVASQRARIPTPAAPLYFIQGNNEIVRSPRGVSQRDRAHPEPALHPERHGVKSKASPSRASAAPSRRRGTTRRGGDLPREGQGRQAPPLRARGGRRVQAARAGRRPADARGAEAVLDRSAVLHEPDASKWRRDVGKAAIAELADALKPRLHCFGHHHRARALRSRGIPTVCVDRVNRSYLLVDADTFAWDAPRL